MGCFLMDGDHFVNNDDYGSAYHTKTSIELEPYFGDYYYGIRLWYRTKKGANGEFDDHGTRISNFYQRFHLDDSEFRKNAYCSIFRACMGTRTCAGFPSRGLNIGLPIKNFIKNFDPDDVLDSDDVRENLDNNRPFVYEVRRAVSYFSTPLVEQYLEVCWVLHLFDEVR